MVTDQGPGLGAVVRRLHRHPQGPRSTAGPAGCVGSGVARRSLCLHNESMPNVLVRDLPADVHAELQRRAEACGQSLQQYLTLELTRLAEKPLLDEVLQRVARRSGGRVGLARAVEDLDDLRGRQ